MEPESNENKNQNEDIDPHLEEIKSLYLEPTFAGSGRGITGFYRELKKSGKDYGFSIDQVRNALETMSAYTQQIPSIVRFPRRHIKKISLGYELQIDLGFLPPTASGKTSFLVCIDNFSQMVYTKSLPNKQAATVRDAFKEILDENQNPLSEIAAVASDFGSEYKEQFQLFCKQRHIKQFFLRSPSHASMAENAIRHLKRRLLTLMRAKFTREWDVLLPGVTDALNNSYNTAIGTTPKNANDWQNEPEVRKAIELNLRRRDRVMQKKYRKIKERDFAIGSYVMPSYKRPNGIWKESDLQRGQIFKIYAKNTDEFPTLYYLKDLQNHPQPGCYYSYEMEPAVSPSSAQAKGTLYAVEKVLDHKTDKDGKHWSLVKWSNYPSKCVYMKIFAFSACFSNHNYFLYYRFNEWVLDTDIPIDNSQVTGEASKGTVS